MSDDAEPSGRLVFRATLPGTGSSFRDLPEGGVRVSFDVPEIDALQAAPLFLLRKKVLRITIEVEDADQPHAGPVGAAVNLRNAAKRRRRERDPGV